MVARKIKTCYSKSNTTSPKEGLSFGNIKLPIQNRKLELLGPLGPIIFDHKCKSLGSSIRERNLSRPLDCIRLAEELIEESSSLLYRWTCVMLIRIYLFWSEFPDGLLSNPSEYLVHSLMYGPAYSKYLKDLRANMFQYKLGAFNSKSFYDKFEKLRQSKFLPLPKEGGCSYDEVLNEKYLIHYEDTSLDFFDYPFRKVNCDELFVEQFELMLDKFLTELTHPIFPPDKEDMVNWITDSTSMEDPVSSSVNRTLMRRLVQEDRLDDLKRPDSRFLRTVVNVGPANVRDAWQCDIPTLFKVKKVSYMMRELVSHHKYSAMASEAKSKRRRKKLKSDSFFVLTDIKKCGLSMPRYLFKKVAELLEKHNIECFSELQSIAEADVYFEGSRYNPERGSGLGNLNEVVTLIQCIIADVAREIDEADDAIFFNDDGVYRVGADKYALPKLVSLYQKYGIIMNIEKSYFSRYNVFCEDYTSTEHDFSKSHLRVLSLSTLYEQTFIHEQKKVYDSIIKDLDIYSEGKIRKDNLLEFHKFETILPTSLGGWKNTSIGGINVVLDYIMNPGKYLDSDDRSMVPLMNKWITYILLNEEEFKDIFYKQKRFEYRSKVKNPFNEDYLDLSLYDLDTIDPILKIDRYQMFENLYNQRGLKNAKPKLHYNYGKYISQRRYSFFRKFWFEKDNLSRTIREDMTGLYTLLRFFRGVEDLSRNLAPPEFIGIGNKVPLSINSKKRKVIYSRAFQQTPETTVRRVNTLLALRDDRVYPNMSLENLTFLLTNRGESYFTLKEGVHILEYEVPSYYSFFFRDKRYFSTIYFNLYKRIPEEWVSSTLSSNLDTDSFRSNIYEKLFGEIVSRPTRSINTVREKSVFYFIVKDRVLRSCDQVLNAVRITKDVCGQLRISENVFIDPSRLAFQEVDVDLITEFYPELAIDFLVEEEYFGEDYEDPFSDGEYDPDSRIDYIDIYSSI